jgi:hypothetical protein
VANNVIDWAFQFDIHYVDKLALVAIADDADRAGVSRYLGSLRTFGKQCSLSERQIRRSLRRLESWGLIKTYPQSRPNGSDGVHHFQCCTGIDPKVWNDSMRPADAKRKGKRQDVQLQQRAIMSTFAKAFEKALQQKFDKHTFLTWIAPCNVVSVQTGRLTMRTPKLVFAEFLHDHTALILEAAAEADPSIKKVHFIIPKENEN